MLAKSVSHKARDTYYIRAVQRLRNCGWGGGEGRGGEGGAPYTITILDRGWGRCGEFTAVLQRHGVTNYTAYMKFVKKNTI